MISEFKEVKMKIIVLHNDAGEPMSAAIQASKKELIEYLQAHLDNDLDEDEVIQVRLSQGSENQLVKALRGTLEEKWDNTHA
jgi:RNA-binding protein YhbY